MGVSVYGPCRCLLGIVLTALNELYRSCDALLNIGGATDLQEWHLAAPLRVYVETDPVIAELQLAKGDAHTRLALANHHTIVTYGENYRRSGLRRASEWSARIGRHASPSIWNSGPWLMIPAAPYFTTIGNYRQTGNDVTYNGETYRWSKHHEWEKFADLPQRSDAAV